MLFLLHSNEVAKLPCCTHSNSIGVFYKLGCPVICSDFIKKPENLEILQFACELILFIQKEELRSEYREFDRMAFSSLATPSSSRFSGFLVKSEHITGHPTNFSK